MSVSGYLSLIQHATGNKDVLIFCSRHLGFEDHVLTLEKFGTLEKILQLYPKLQDINAVITSTYVSVTYFLTYHIWLRKVWNVKKYVAFRCTLNKKWIHVEDFMIIRVLLFSPSTCWNANTSTRETGTGSTTSSCKRVPYTFMGGLQHSRGRFFLPIEN